MDFMALLLWELEGITHCYLLIGQCAHHMTPLPSSIYGEKINAMESIYALGLVAPMSRV